MLRIAKIINVVCNSNNLPTLRNGNKISQLIQGDSLKCKISFGVSYSNDLDADTQAKPRKKTLRIPKITLVNLDNSITVTLLEEAHKLAKRRKLELVQVFNNTSKNDRDMYKLVNPTEKTKLQEEGEIKEYNKNKRKRKSTKLFILKHKTDDRDIMIKINNINKSLKKGHKVKIVHTNPDKGNDNILQTIKRKVEGSLVTEKSQNDSTMLTYSPLLEEHVNDDHEPKEENR